VNVPYPGGMRHPWANLALLGLVAAQVATGLASLLAPPAGVRIAVWAHAIGAYAILVVLFGKATVVWDAVRRRPGLGAARAVLAAMVLLLAAVLGTGLIWITAGRYALLGISGINLHAYLALVLAALVGWHALDRRWVARVPRAADRAAVLRMGAVAVAGLVVWQVERTAQALIGTPGSRRRYTGSYEIGSSGGSFPVTSWLNDDAPAIDPRAWRLVVEGAVDRPVAIGLAELRALPRETEQATLDCTGGWYTRQAWSGVRLGRVLALAGVRASASSVEVHSATGYRRRFALDHAAGLLLATSVAGRPLSRGHGSPARLVVPGHRGFEWVKWVTRIEVLRSSHLLQPPLPLT
jgi:DMSO/TMAO reductase YedYZ molybdopterin-dependent catalytic subunit